MDHFDRYDLHVIHPGAHYNVPISTISQDGFHHVNVEFRYKNDSWIYHILVKVIR